MRLYTRYILVVVFVFCKVLFIKAQNLPGSNERIVELQKQLSTHKKNDTAKVKLLNDIAFEFNRISPYDGIKYANESIELAEKLHWELGIARANSCLGANYYSLSDFSNAYKYWLIALNINEEQGFGIGVANHLHNIGNIFFSQKNYTKALEYYEKGLKSSEEIGNTKIVTNSYTSIGNVYTQLKDYKVSLSYHFKALAIDEKLGSKSNIAADEINIGSVFNEQGEYASALEILFRAGEIKKEIGDRNGLANAYNMIGKVFLNIAKDTSLTAYKDSSEYNLQQAISYLDSAIIIDKEIGYLDNMQKSYESLSTAYQMLNNYQSAFDIYKLSVVIKDSIFSVNKETEIFNLEKKAEIEENKRAMEKEEEAKERSEYIQMVGVCLFILLLVTTIILLRRKKINPRVIEVLGTLSVLIFFEFINLLLHGKIEQVTHHNLILTLLCLLIVASIIIPIHHKMEHWMKKRVSHKAEIKTLPQQDIEEAATETPTDLVDE